MSNKNFVEQEINILTLLIDKYKNVIFNKCTSATSNQKKDDGWKKLTEEFNANNGVTRRTQKQLICKFKNMRKIAQRRRSADKVAIFATGGGPGKLSSTPLDEQLNAIGVLTQPSDNPFDCDASYGDTVAIQVEQMSIATAEQSQLTCTEESTFYEDDGSQMENSFLRTPVPQDAETGIFHLQSTQSPSITRVPLVTTQTSTPLVIETLQHKRIPLVKGGRKRGNTTEKAVISLVDAAKKREAVLSIEIEMKRKESEQRLYFEQLEHELRIKLEEAKLKVEEMKMIAEEERIKTLVAKRLYYETQSKK